MTNLEFNSLSWLNLPLAHITRIYGRLTPFSKCRAVTCFKQILSGDEVLFVIRQDGMVIYLCMLLDQDQALLNTYDRARNIVC